MNKFTLIFLPVLLLSQSLYGFNPQSYIRGLQAPSNDPQQDMAVFNAIDACGSGQIDAQCAVDNLSRLANKNNALAAQVLSQFNSTQSEGRVNSVAECRTQQHLETNYILGNCVLVMYQSAIRDQSREQGATTFETCVQGGLIGLAYEGYMSSQYLLYQFYNSIGNQQSADIWKKSLDFKKGTEEDKLMRKCYF